MAATELSGSALIRARVPSQTDWEQAAAHVREQWADTDVAVAAPEWADPLLRLQLGDLLGLDGSAPFELAPYERVWQFSIRGHRSDRTPERLPDEEQRFGRVLVQRWDLGPSPVVYDFTGTIDSAEVDVDGRACREERLRQHEGGLFHGPLQPKRAFFCGPHPWLWVGPTVIEDPGLQPRHCIWQHPQAGDEPTTTTYRDVPLGDRISVHATMFYIHQREGEHGPVTLQVLVDGQEVGRMVHRDGDGVEHMDVDPDPLERGNVRGDVSFVVSAPQPHYRSICWGATSQQGEREL